MATLMRVFGLIWALLGTANIIKQDWTAGGNPALTFALIFNTLEFVFPGLIVLGSDRAWQVQSGRQPGESPVPIARRK